MIWHDRLQLLEKMRQCGLVQFVRNDNTAINAACDIHAGCFVQLSNVLRPPRESAQAPIENLTLGARHFRVRRQHRRGDTRRALLGSATTALKDTEPVPTLQQLPGEQAPQQTATNNGNRHCAHARLHLVVDFTTLLFKLRRLFRHLLLYIA